MSTGTLYVVATPIGNLADASSRAAEALGSADVVACEDTRTSRPLLAHLGVSGAVVALHEHNERTASQALVERMREGASVALITDAGTPGISDPGALLVEAAHRNGIRVIPIPGPNAAVAACSAAGFSGSRFFFAGFLPTSGRERRDALSRLTGPWPAILYEAPHRILKTAADLLDRFGPSREIVIAREITKKFEEIARMPLGDAPAWLQAGPHRQQGEFVLVLAPLEEPEDRDASRAVEVLEILLESLAPSEAARAASRITGAPRKRLYDEALARAKRKMQE
jgi:16S rRNA (cytidine1402-2'-O)-methyltransferase